MMEMKLSEYQIKILKTLRDGVPKTGKMLAKKIHPSKTTEDDQFAAAGRIVRALGEMEHAKLVTERENHFWKITRKGLSRIDAPIDPRFIDDEDDSAASSDDSQQLPDQTGEVSGEAATE